MYVSTILPNVIPTVYILAMYKYVMDNNYVHAISQGPVIVSLYPDNTQKRTRLTSYT